MTIRIFERSCIQEFTFGSIVADSTGGGPLDFLVAANQKIPNGILRGVSVACLSTNFDVSIRTKSNAQADTVDEVYRVTGINKFRSDDDLRQGWVNNDTPIENKLYLTLTNVDGVNDTGIVTVKILTDINKRFAKHTG